MRSSLDDFLEQEGDFDEARVQAIKEVVAWQLAAAMKERKLSRNKMAALLKTSRTQVNRLLDPQYDITLSSLQRAAAIAGQRAVIELVQVRWLWSAVEVRGGLAAASRADRAARSSAAGDSLCSS